MRAGSGGRTEKVCLDIADVVRDELTILHKKIEDLRQLGAFMFTEAAWCGRIVR